MSAVLGLPDLVEGRPHVKLAEKWRPRKLDEVVGQDLIVAYLKRLVQKPHSTCLLFESADGGCGKTSTALAMANEMGCTDDMSGLTVQPCSELSVDRCRQLFSETLRYRPFQGNGWRVLILEELDWLNSQVQRFLKVALETQLPGKCLVVATSNDASKLDGPFRQRFSFWPFQAGAAFKADCQARLLEIWKCECVERGCAG